MAGFSGTVKVADLNDFIAPSQACVLNLDGSTKQDEQPGPQLEVGKVQLQKRAGSAASAAVGPVPPPSSFPQAGTKTVTGGGGGWQGTHLSGDGNGGGGGGAVKVTLNDCLACSGCVTSAETVLLEQQSVAELLSKLGIAANSGGDAVKAQPTAAAPVPGAGQAGTGAASATAAGAVPAAGANVVVVVVSVSPQVCASLAVLYGLSSQEVLRRLAHFFRSLGAAHVLDLGAARDIALAEAAAEFVARFRWKQQQQQQAGVGGRRPNGAPAALPPSSSSSSASRPPAAAVAERADAAAAAAAPAHAGGGQFRQPSEAACVDMMDVDQAVGGPPSGGGEQQEEEGEGEDREPPGPLPMLASACPGWVCYAEKTHGDHVLPYIAASRSPQAVQGSLVKRWLAAARGYAPGGMYHVTLMPCYDKKLEASRSDFELPSAGEATAAGAANGGSIGGEPLASASASAVPEVDCVLTSGEVHELLQAQGVDLGGPGVPSCLPDSIVDLVARTAPPCALSSSPAPTAPPAAAPAVAEADTAGYNGSSGGGGGSGGNGGGGGSGDSGSGDSSSGGGGTGQVGVAGGAGGYLEYVFRTAARELFGRDLPPGQLPMRQLRNADMREVELLDDGGRVLLRFAAAYGFRNIQTLMRKVKRRACEYDYVEVMACPGACNNGGGQVRPAAGETPQQLLERVEAAYAADVTPHDPLANPQAKAVYSSWVGGAPGGQAARRLLHTGYHRREKPAAVAMQDW